MIGRLAVAPIYVRDQDEALSYYTDKLGFEKRTDETVDGFRWLTVAPKEQREVEILLMKAISEEQQGMVGKQDLYALYTDDCRKDYETLRTRGVKFTGEPQEQPWGIEALFEDLYGNVFDLVEPR